MLPNQNLTFLNEKTQIKIKTWSLENVREFLLTDDSLRNRTTNSVVKGRMHKRGIRKYVLKTLNFEDDNKLTCSRIRAESGNEISNGCEVRFSESRVYAHLFY